MTQDVLTDLAVVPKIATIGSRIFAAFIDGILLIVGSWFIADHYGMAYVNEGSIGFNLTGTPALIAVGYWFLLLPVLEGTTGKTIGKRVAGITVVKNDLTKTDLGRSIVRHLFDIVDCILLVGLIIASSKQNKQRIGDMVAGTLVVKNK